MDTKYNNGGQETDLEKPFDDSNKAYGNTLNDGSSKDFSDNDHQNGIPSNFISHKTTSKSIGVRKSEIILAQNKNPITVILLYISIFFVAYTYALDGTIRGTLQGYATNSYAKHSLISTVGVIRGVAAAASQPVYARLSDRFGRLEICIVSIIFYSMGTVIESQAYDVERFAGGAVLYQIGYSGIIVMLEIILADFSNLNWRLTASFIPALPFIINTWISANVLDSIYPKNLWNWGIGMWAFIFPLACVPFLAILTWMWLKARKTPEWAAVCEDEKIQHPTWISWKKNIIIDVFWEIDIIGCLFIVCVFGFILAPFTLAGGISDKWKRGSIIAPLVIGFVLIPFFVVWEKRFAKHPIVPFPLLKDRGVWAALFVAVCINWIWYMPNDYMYTVLLVAMNQSIKAAQRITSLYSFVSVITGPLLGLVIVKVRRTKGFIIFGVAMWMVSLGLMVHYRGDNSGFASEKFVNGVIGALCLMGFGAGFFTYTTQVSIATCTNHEHMAVIISLYLASYNIGSALGASISGAIWTNLMEKEIVKQMTKLGVDTTLAVEAYGSPYTFIATYTWGSTERQAVVFAYAHIQKILCIVGLCLCVPLMAAVLFLRDHTLESVQSLEENHQNEGIKKDNEVVVNNYDHDPIYNFLFGRFSKRGN